MFKLFVLISSLIFSLLLSQSTWAFSYTQEITEAEIQQKVASMMPMEK
ncbi:hypothetical protein MNBD_GAMMA07-2711, partial [hydrothermal vent metagenome]